MIVYFLIWNYYITRQCEVNMNTKEIKNKKGLYSKLTELYRDLDLLQWRKQCNEDITLHDTHDIIITDNTTCQSIYTTTINNLIKQINRYEKELDDIDKDVSYADRLKDEWISRKRYSSISL